MAKKTIGRPNWCRIFASSITVHCNSKQVPRCEYLKIKQHWTCHLDWGHSSHWKKGISESDMSLGSFRRFLSLKNELTFWFETKTEHPGFLFEIFAWYVCVCVCVSVCLEQESLYGKRDGHISGLAIISKDSKNVFRSTRGFKTGTILGVDMLQRQDMFKPQARHRLLLLEFLSLLFQFPTRNHHTRKK